MLLPNQERLRSEHAGNVLLTTDGMLLAMVPVLSFSSSALEAFGFCATLLICDMVVVEARRLSRFLMVETQVEGKFYVNKKLEELMFEELRQHCGARGKLSASILPSRSIQVLAAFCPPANRLLTWLHCLALLGYVGSSNMTPRSSAS